MTTQRDRTKFTRAAAGVCGALLLTVLTACAPDATVSAPNSATAELSEEARTACSDVFSRVVEDTTEHIVIINDLTASGSPTVMPASLSDHIAAASLADGSLTVISVDGKGGTPIIIAKHAALSTAGARDRPSVAELASYMPACVEQVLLPQTPPSVPGTDLHRPLALATELTGPNTTVYLLSDFVSTSGSFTLDAELLSLTPTDAASRIANAAPLDLHGALLRIEGIGNTSTALLTANRDWLRELSVELCSHWNATGCNDIVTNPVNAVLRDGLPADPLPPFPSVTTSSTAQTCTFEAPASLTFAGNSAALASNVTEIFAPAIALLNDNQSATATIVGHTASSSTSPADGAQELSQQRADAVAAMLIDNGIGRARLTVIGVGDTQPKVEDIDPATGQQIEHLAAIERRVDVIVEGAPCPA